MHGIGGEKFQSPLASPGGVGESSPVINVIWGLVNFFIGYALVFGVGKFNFGFNLDVLMVALGVLLTAIALASYFGRVRDEAKTKT